MDENSKRVSWNASQFLIFEIGVQRRKANDCYIIGDLSKAFKCLQSIRMTVVASLNQDERLSLNNKEKDIEKNIFVSSRFMEWGIDDAVIKEKNEAMARIHQLYQEYNELLMDALENHGYLIKEQEDSSQMRF